MPKLAVGGIVVIVLFLLGVLNPAPTAHRQQIAQTYANENPVTGAIGVGEALGAVASYHDYVFFSTTSLGGRRVSVGAVWTVQPPVRQEILKELPEWMREKLQSPADGTCR